MVPKMGITRYSWGLMEIGFWSSAWCRSAVVCLFALMLHLAGTSVLPLVDRDEPRFAEATREMLERGDYLIPHFNGGYRFDKPILIYWCQALSVRLFGESDWAVRLPSVVSAALTAAAVFGFGRRAAGERVGLWAALIFTTCLQVQVHARMAVADFVLILFMTLGFWAGWELLRADPGEPGKPRFRWRWWWLFYVSLALGFLAKGPLAWLPLVSTVLMGWRNPNGRRRLKPISGMALVLILVGFWGIPALVATQGDFFRVGIGRHVVQRSVGVLEGHGAGNILVYLALLPIYFVTVFPSFFPWSCLLPSLVRQRWFLKDRSPFERYLLVGILLNFGIFSLIRTKLPHYTLPCFPLLALWMAIGLSERPLGVKWFRRLFAVGVGLGALAGWLLIPRIVSYFPSERLYEQAKEWLKPTMEFASTDYDEPSLVWCFRRKIHGWHHPMAIGELAGFMEKDGPRFCVLPTDKISIVFPNLPPSWKSCRSAGFNFVHFKQVDLTLLLKPD